MHVKFYLKELAKKGDCQLYARINYCYDSTTQKYKVLKYYTDLRLSPNKWDVKNQCAKKGMVGKPEFDLRITDAKEKIQRCFNAYVNEHGKEPEIHTLKKLLVKEFTGFQKEAQEDILRTFWGYFQEFINQSINGIRKNTKGDAIADSTIKNYKTLFKHLKAFEAQKKIKIEFINIDFEFYTDLIHFFENDLFLAKNSISKHIRTLKTILRESMENGYHNNNKFNSRKFSAPTELTTAVYLNDKELKELYHLNLADDSKLERVRDLFLIGCYTGLRFGDLKNISTKNIAADHLNPKDYYLTIKQTKTGAPVTIPLHPIVKVILDKYNNQLPKPLSNQKTNKFLKEICQKIPILKESISVEFTKGGMKVIEVHPKYMLVSTHTARRSFSTNAYLAGQQTLNIMAVTGHQTEKSFNRYLRVTPMEKARLFKQHRDKAAKLRAV